MKKGGIKTKYPTASKFRNKSIKYEISKENRSSIVGWRNHMGITQRELDAIFDNVRKWDKREYETLTNKQKIIYDYWMEMGTIYMNFRDRLLELLEGRIIYASRNVNIQGTIIYLKKIDKGYADKKHIKENTDDTVVVNFNFKGAGRNKI